jgi:hypothetical protein
VIEFPPDRERRADKVRRIRSRYTSLRVTRATAQLVGALVDALDALSIDEALFYVVMREIGLERARLALVAPPRPQIVVRGSDAMRAQ